MKKSLLPSIKLAPSVCFSDMELPAVMASLQIEENKSEGDSIGDAVEAVEAGDPTTPRLLRKRLGGPLLCSLKRQRVSPKTPEKLNSDKDIMDYYIKVNKKWSVKQTNLETIFEEPKETTDGGVVTMSGAKVRRAIVFTGRLTKTKKMKRSAKMKKFQLTKAKSEKKRKLSLDEVKLRLTLFEPSE